MGGFVIPIDAAQAGDPEQVGPKAANLALLARAGLPTPGGFCLTAAAYHCQVAALGLEEALGQFSFKDPRAGGRLSVEIRLGLYEQPIADEIVVPLLAMWRECRGVAPGPWAVRS